MRSSTRTSQSPHVPNHRADSDGYDGQFGVQPIDSEAATSAAVSGSNLAGS